MSAQHSCRLLLPFTYEQLAFFTIGAVSLRTLHKRPILPQERYQIKYLINTKVDQINISIDAETPSLFHGNHGVVAFVKAVNNAHLLSTARNKVGSEK